MEKFFFNTRLAVEVGEILPSAGFSGWLKHDGIYRRSTLGFQYRIRHQFDVLHERRSGKNVQIFFKQRFIDVLFRLFLGK